MELKFLLPIKQVSCFHTDSEARPYQTVLIFQRKLGLGAACLSCLS